MRILVVQTAFLGDCVLSLPFLHALHAEYPEASVDIVAAGPGAELFEIALRRGLRALAPRTRVHRFEKRGRHAGPRGLYRFARADLDPGGQGFDVAFCLQRSFRSAALARLAGARELVGFSTGAVSFLYTQLVRRAWESGRSEVEKNLDLLRAFSRKALPTWSPLHAPSLLAAEAAHTGAPKPIAIALGSPWATKRWPTEHSGALAERLTSEGVDVVLLGDPAAVSLGMEVKRLAPSLLVKDLTGKTTIEAWIDAIAGARGVVANDSAAVHVASDLNVPVVALFGPTLPEFGFAPWRTNSVALGVSHLACRPCHIHGPKVCPKGHHRCLRDLTAEHVYPQLASRLGLDQDAGPR